MAKIKLTKNEQKAQKDALKMYQRYLPTLTLKKQQLQSEIRIIDAKAKEVRKARVHLEEEFKVWIGVFGEEDAFKSDMVTVRNIKKGFSNIAGVTIPVYEGAGDFKENAIGSHKLASIVTLDEDFVSDAGFNIEKYLTEKLGKCFGKAEDNAFINGTGEDEPVGILHNKNGAEVGMVTSNLTYDDVIALYFSVEKEYRRNGVWLMNDGTALVLRKLKDADGNYLWNQANDTILGKQVIISEYMPDIEVGTKPIAFGDFSYYWIVGRKPVSIRTLLEKFVVYDQIGYLAFEFLDGKLVRKEAIKVIQMADAKE